MITTEFRSTSSAPRCLTRRRCPVFAPNRLGQRRFGPFRASEGHDSGLLEIRQPLQVVAGCHHRHREARPRLADGSDQLAAHLRDGRERVFHPRSRPRDARVPPLLAFGQRLVALSLALDLIPKAVRLQPGRPLLGRIAAIGIDVAARVARVEDVVEVLAVVRAGRVGLERADEFVLLVDVDRQLVAEVALAVFLRPGGVGVLLPALGRLPVGRHRALVDQRLLPSAVVLLGGRHQGGVDDLPATRDEAPFEQLRRDALEERLRAKLTDPVLEGPHRGAVRNIGCVREPAEAFVAHAVEQLVLHLLVRQVVQALEHQDPNHRLRRVRRTAALRADRARCDPIDLGGQRRKVDVQLDVGQRVAQRVELLAVVFVSEQVSLDSATRFHRCRQQQDSGRCNFTKSGRDEVFRGAQ